MERQIRVLYLDFEALAFNPLKNLLIQVVVARQKLASPGGKNSFLISELENEFLTPRFQRYMPPKSDRTAHTCSLEALILMCVLHVAIYCPL